MRFVSRGRRSFWWSWRMTLVAPRIVNDLPYVSTVLGSRMQHGNANEMLGLSDAMKTTRSPQRRARRKGNKMLDGRMRRRQRAARSSVRTAEQRRSRYMGCNRGNAQPTAAHAPLSNEIHWSMSTPWCHTFVVLVLLVTYVICHTVTVCYMLYCYPN